MYNVAWYLISNTIISVAVVILVEYGFVQTQNPTLFTLGRCASSS